MSDEILNAAEVNGTETEKPGNALPQRDFGVYLREARQAAGLVTADVAERLKLSEDIIKSLEGSRIDLLPAAAFTQGYIKAYAKLLKISPDEVMRAFDVMVPNKVAALNLNTGLPAEHSSRDAVVKVTSYVLVVLALVLFAFWIQQSGFELSGNFKQITDVKDAETVTEFVEPELYPDSMPSFEPLSPLATVPANQPQAQSLAITPPDKKIIMPEKPVSNLPAVEKKIEVKPENNILTRPVIRNEQTMPVISVAPEANATSDDIMKLQASSESWAEVQDADNNRLFYSLLKTGNTYAIKGRAPFRVFLGNAPSVSIEVNNQAVDVSRYIRQNNIAHVKISSRASTQVGGPRVTTNQVVDQFVPETPVTAE